MPAELEAVTRIQSFLRESARGQYVAHSIPPFTLFFHPTDSTPYFSYAIPDIPLCFDLESQRIGQAVAQLKAVFHSRARIPRFEFFEAFAPALPGLLADHGFIEEGRHWCMLCTPQSARPARAVPGLDVAQVGAGSPDEDIRAFIATQRAGFNPSDQSIPTPEAVESARRDFGEHGWTAYLGRLAGVPAGAAVCSRPLQGICEIAGVATRVEYRGRGVASSLTALATAGAFARGVHTAVLSAEDERAGRVYQRLGYQPFSVLLAYRAESGGR